MICVADCYGIGHVLVCAHKTSLARLFLLICLYQIKKVRGYFFVCSNLIKIRYLTKLLFITDMSRRGRSEITLLRLYNHLYKNRKKSDVYEYLWPKAIPI